jgi:hypothetical protein
MISDDPSLAALFAEAVAHAKRPLSTKRLPDPEAVNPRLLYTNPDNWRPTRGVALIHEETGSVLGTFQELVHISDPGTRRLIRATSPISVSATERVSGDWWVAQYHEIASPEAWHERRTLILPVQLTSLGVQSPLVELSIHLAHGNIARVELVEDSMFAQLPGQPDQLLHLPAGANILPVMSQDSKVALRAELGRKE